MKVFRLHWHLFFLISGMLCGTLAYADLVDDIDKDYFSEPLSKEKTPNQNQIKDLVNSSDDRADKKQTPKVFTSDKECLVHFKSRELNALKPQGIIELIGDVVVKKCELEIRAKRAKIFLIPGTDQVKSIRATGHVKMTNYEHTYGKNIKANGHEAVFHSQSNQVTLLGKPARLDREGNLFNGERIVYELDSGWIRASDVKGVVQKKE